MRASLEARSLRVERGGRPVLNGVSFSVAPGEVFALLGGNGAGKSTTLLTFLGFLAPASGAALVAGREVGGDVGAARRAVSYLPEAATLYGHLDAYENLGYFMSLAGTKAGEEDMDAALDKVALQAGARRERLETYSKGMRQKVAIALAILRDTRILLLDEPTSGLDPAVVDEFNRLMRELADQNRAILMVTHDVYGACQVADRINLLRAGELAGAFERPPGGHIDTEAVHAAFAEGATI